MGSLAATTPCLQSQGNNEIEEWRDVSGYEGIYRVSNTGKIMSVGRLVKFAICSTKQTDDIILKPCPTGVGYHAVNLNKRGNHKKAYVHRLVALHFIPNPENKKTVNHKNGIKTDNRSDNLEWLSLSDNHKHAYALGLKKPQRNGPAVALWIKNNPEKRRAMTDKANHTKLLKKLAEQSATA